MDKKKITTLFRQYYGRMYGMAVSILYDEQESKDVVSDIFERLLVTDTQLLPDTVEHYLLTSVRNSCLKCLAQKSNRQRIAQHYASEQQLADSTEKDELQLERMIRFAQTHLTPQQQSIFKMRFLAGMKYEEIGEELGISRVAVWKHLSRITTIIKEQFKNSEL
nr:sigma-70 family RNA polymerase sigma factor [uncultured Prevotella sp.]